MEFDWNDSKFFDYIKCFKVMFFIVIVKILVYFIDILLILVVSIV